MWLRDPVIEKEQIMLHFCVKIVESRELRDILVVQCKEGTTFDGWCYSQPGDLIMKTYKKTQRTPTFQDPCLKTISGMYTLQTKVDTSPPGAKPQSKEITA